MFQYTDTTLQSFTRQEHQNRTIKTTISQQYTSFVFPFPETRSVDVTSVDRENSLSQVLSHQLMLGQKVIVTGSQSIKTY